MDQPSRHRKSGTTPTAPATGSLRTWRSVDQYGQGVLDMSSPTVKTERPTAAQASRIDFVPVASPPRRAPPQYHFIPMADRSIGASSSSHSRMIQDPQRLHEPLIEHQSTQGHLGQQLREIGETMNRQAVGMERLQRLMIEQTQHLSALIANLELGLYGGFREVQCSLRYSIGEYEKMVGLHCPHGAPSNTDEAHVVGNRDGREPGGDYHDSGANFDPLRTTQSTRH